MNDEKTHVDPWSHTDTFEGWTVLTETIVLGPFDEFQSKISMLFYCIRRI